MGKPEQPTVVLGAPEGGSRVAFPYLRVRIEHILLGVDHLLFVLGLVLIVKDGWTLRRRSSPSPSPTASPSRWQPSASTGFPMHH